MHACVRSTLAALCALALGCQGEAESADSTRGAVRARAGRDKVIVLVIDALRADHLGVHGYGRDTTPTIDRLARTGLHLPHVVVQAPQTAPSIASILTGTLPSQHGVQYYSRTRNFTGKKDEHGAPVLPERAVTIAEWLGRHGFHTAGVVANPWLRADLGFGQGFASYTELDCYRPRSRRPRRAKRRGAPPAQQKSASLCDGARINALAEKILTERADEPVFLYLHYLDAHSPYAHDGALPARWREAPGRDVFHGNGPAPRVAPEDLRYTMALYDEGIAYADSLVDRLLRFLAEKGLSEHTTLLVTTDHGEEFLEHGGLGHGTSLHHELLQSFAVIWSPKRVEAARIDERRAAVDLFPTLLGLLGIDSPGRLAGRDVLARPARGARDIVAELADQKALLRGEWKLVLKLEPRRSELTRIDLAGAPLGAAGPDDAPVSQAMQAALDELIRTASKGAVEALDDESAAALRALGYLN
jgi:arylsulfatase A-like enzyme